jgi:hypothetical protein
MRKTILPLPTAAAIAAGPAEADDTYQDAICRASCALGFEAAAATELRSVPDK